MIGAVASGAALHDGQAARALQPSTGAHSANGALAMSPSVRSASVVPSVTLRPGARGEAVRQLQNSLNASGASLNVDGVFGPATTRAVRSYQSKKGLAVDGIVGARTRAALNGSGSQERSQAPAPSNRASSSTLRRGDRGSAVTTLQKKLNASGAKLTVDGSFGSATDRAVRGLQANAGLTVDGVVGSKTWRALDGDATVPSNRSNSSGSSSSAPSAAQPTLRSGSRGASVKTLQSLLNERGASLTVDGVFGRSTLSAVRSLQQSAGITVDGVAGAKTWRAVSTSSVRISADSGSRGTDRSAPPAGSTAPVSTPSASFDGQAVIAAARSQMGKPYVWGGHNPARGFDCSGLVHYAYNQAGVSMPRKTARGYTFGGRIISQSEAQPGDLVAFTANNYGHIGIYVGNGNIIDASGSRRQVVERSIWNSPHVFVTYR